jgi:hypothetical protein
MIRSIWGGWIGFSLGFCCVGLVGLRLATNKAGE